MGEETPPLPRFTAMKDSWLPEYEQTTLLWWGKFSRNDRGTSQPPLRGRLADGVWLKRALYAQAGDVHHAAASAGVAPSETMVGSGECRGVVEAVGYFQAKSA